MTPRKLGLYLAICLGVIIAPRVFAQGQNPYLSAPVFQNEGRDPVTFNVTLTSTSLTLIVSSDTIARSTFFQSISSNTSSFCLAPSSGSSACNSSWAGVQLAPNSSLTDYSRSAWYGRVPGGIGNQTIMGYRTRDRADYGAIGAAGH